MNLIDTNNIILQMKPLVSCNMTRNLIDFRKNHIYK